MATRPEGAAGVLVAVDNQPWEPEVLQALAQAPDFVTVRRCLDLNDLLAVAATGTARLAVVAAPGPGIDRDLVDRLAASGVAVVAVVAAGGTPAWSVQDATARLGEIGVDRVLPSDDLGDLVAVLRTSLPGPDDEAVGPHPREVTPPGTDRSDPGQVVAVWGTGGAPGRTTVATGLASALAREGCRTMLLDADPYGGTVAQQLGLLDDTSGLLAAARHANTGSLDPDRLRAGCRSIGERLEVLTGLPRPDRWSEVRPASLEQVIDTAARCAEVVVVDCGFGGEAGSVSASPRGRDALVSVAVQRAQRCVIVGSAEPVGLTRLARLLVDARQVRAGGIDDVVVNKMRAGLGWREREIVDMVSRLTSQARVHVVPFDLSAVDKAAQVGRSVVETGGSALSGALLALAAAQTVSSR